MGLRSRLKGKIKDTVQGVGALARIIHDEANHPGRPQPHMAARNPLWGGGDVTDEGVNEGTDETKTPIEQTVSDAPPVVPSEAASQSNDTEDEYWFLHDPDGEVDDWSRTNPKKS